MLFFNSFEKHNLYKGDIINKLYIKKTFANTIINFSSKLYLFLSKFIFKNFEFKLFKQKYSKF